MGTEIMMKGTAWFVYFVDFLVNIIGDWFGAGELISFIFMALAYAGFALWFAFHRVSIVDPKYAKEFFVKMVISVIPIVNVFYFTVTKNGSFVPGIRGMVENIIERSKEEDREYNQKIIASRTPQNQQKPQRAGGPVQKKV